MTLLSFLPIWKMIWSMTGIRSKPCVLGFIASLPNTDWQFAAQRLRKVWGQTRSCHCPEAKPTWLLGSSCHPHVAPWLTSCHLKVIADVNFIDAQHRARLYSPLLENTRLLFQRAVSDTLVMFKPAAPGWCWTAQHHSRCCFLFF